ncbi:N-acetylmuramoyl-L-alanine amidase [Microbispora amethystogenes]|uniref:N-acetylmuramoyl-L-alanine amidase n=1 Tax=Microbispora amethystogenes TaxID=1427754 RepID=UPI0033C34C40
MAKMITRREWGAKTPKAAYTRIPGTAGVKIHYTGGHVPPAILTDHEECGKLVRQIQSMHMAGAREQPYIDIGYSLAVCPHRRIFMGRGAYALPAANGPGLNTGHYAVLALVGSLGFTEPNDGLLQGLRDAIEWLREHGNAGNQIKGHRDGYATSCPGDPLYAWIKKGAPRPASPTPETVPVITKQTKTTEALVRNLPVLKPGDEHRHVKTMRGLLFARGYEPTNLHSTTYGKDDTDLLAKVRAFKEAKKIPSGKDDLVWDAACWEAALT